MAAGSTKSRSTTRSSSARSLIPTTSRAPPPSPARSTTSSTTTTRSRSRSHGTSPATSSPRSWTASNSPPRRRHSRSPPDRDRTSGEQYLGATRKCSVAPRSSGQQRGGVAAGVGAEQVDEVGVQAAALQAAGGVRRQQPRDALLAVFG